VKVVESDSYTQRAEEVARRLEATEEEVLVLGQSLRQAEASQRDTKSDAQLQQVITTMWLRDL